MSGHRPLPACEPKLITGISPCPEHLSAAAKKEWAYVVAELQGLGILTRADKAVLAGYCQEFAAWAECERFIAENGSVIETATGARRQPLLFAITTAGHDPTSLAWELHDYSTKILEGILADDSHFAFIATLDERDDWQNERVWVKANPNLNISVKIDSLREQCEKAKQLPSAINAFRRLRCNEWTESHSAWLDVASWDACGAPIDPDELEGRPCFGGLDLASTTDITAFTLLFPDDSGGYDLLNWFWVPEESIATRSPERSRQV
jgi:P27 family predicted phage terminase small subunit